MISLRHIISNRSLFLAVAMLSLGGSAQAQAALFEVERNDSTKLLRVNDDGGFVVFAVPGGAIPAQGKGARLMWHPKKWALRAGYVQGQEWDDGSMGLGSVAVGTSTIASGQYSFAFGYEARAEGASSIAGGEGSVTSGSHAVALGEKVTAAWGAAAFGSRTVATGARSFAAGQGTRALGNSSVALGEGVTAQGDGSFIFGDHNVSYQRPAQTNQFVVRAFGGVLLNTAALVGCELAPNSGTWSCASSRMVKEGFEDTDAEDVLGKVAGLSIQRWRYIGSAVEHIGPVAEEFRQAFGLGVDSTRIDGVDADGIALRAIQALERRTVALQEGLAALQAANGALEADNSAMRSELAELRARMAALAGHAARAEPNAGGGR